MHTEHHGKSPAAYEKQQTYHLTREEKQLNRKLTRKRVKVEKVI